MSSKHAVIVAGEVSGDHHAAQFVRQLQSKNIRFSGMGGQQMQAAGVDIIYDLTQVSVTGFTEVLKQFKRLKRAFGLIKQHLRETSPDLLILVDYPGFNLRLAKYAKTLGIKVLYYISPQIWAWKKGRIHTIRQTVDMMAVILPFEKTLYRQEKIPVQFVGHPLSDNVQPTMTAARARRHFGLISGKPVVALLPGSRNNEINRMIPLLLDAVMKLPPQDYQYLLPIAPNLDPTPIKALIERKQAPVTLIKGMALDVMNCCDCAIVASGTASLECALLEKPMAIIYRTSRLTYTVATQVIKVRYLGLCNLLADSMIVPELIQADCNANTLADMIKQLTSNPHLINGITHNLAQIKHTLSPKAIDCSMPELIQQQLNLN